MIQLGESVVVLALRAPDDRDPAVEAGGDRRPQRCDAAARGREARDGVVVASDERLHLADPFEDRGRAERSVIILGPRERGRVLPQGLVVREQPPAPLGPPPTPLKALPTP